MLCLFEPLMQQAAENTCMQASKCFQPPAASPCRVSINAKAINRNKPACWTVKRTEIQVIFELAARQLSCRHTKKDKGLFRFIALKRITLGTRVVLNVMSLSGNLFTSRFILIHHLWQTKEAIILFKGFNLVFVYTISFPH